MVKSIALFLLLSVFAIGSCVAKEQKIAFLDYQAVAQQLPQMAEINQTIHDEFKGTFMMNLRAHS